MSQHRKVVGKVDELFIHVLNKVFWNFVRKFYSDEIFSGNLSQQTINYFCLFSILKRSIILFLTAVSQILTLMSSVTSVHIL